MDALWKEFVQMVKQSGWRQREVARQLELTKGAVSHIMTGRNRPNPTVVRLRNRKIESRFKRKGAEALRRRGPKKRRSGGRQIKG